MYLFWSTYNWTYILCFRSAKHVEDKLTQELVEELRTTTAWASEALPPEKALHVEAATEHKKQAALWK